MKLSVKALAAAEPKVEEEPVTEEPNEQDQVEESED